MNVSKPGPPNGIPDSVWQDLYEQLHEIAEKHMRRERDGHLLQTTAVLHEAYLRLHHAGKIGDDRNKFMAAAANTMRRVLIDNSRMRDSQKRGGQYQRIELCDAVVDVGQADNSVEELHVALSAFKEIAPDEARMIEMMAFGGMTGEEVASLMGVSASTVDRRIRFAKAWLRRELSQ